MRLNRLRNALVAAPLVASLATQAQPAAPAPSYAIMSMVGDKMTLVIHQIGTGSNLDANRRIEVPMPDDTLHGMAAFAADDAVRRLQANAKTSLFVTRDPKLLALQDKLTDSKDDMAALAQQLKPLLASSSASHLLLITKHRAEARLRVLDGSIGSGRLSGLGFYVDKETRMTERDTGNHSTGFVAPYAYLSVTAFDMATLRPLRQEAATASETVSTAASKAALVPWDAMTTEQKFDALKRVTRTAIDTIVPKVLEAQDSARQTPAQALK
ncbi:hypothetical protein [Piscinibacter sp. XHJ-5]|uniref:hypothetical protein n=1 Tax=Piscinibacter sp. XHJ-5 TaxID=3037797 RepID=UPI002452C9EE|nr:hypothetical protein [Piscinibacter sp. XHJ-5]